MTEAAVCCAGYKLLGDFFFKLVVLSELLVCLQIEKFDFVLILSSLSFVFSVFKIQIIGKVVGGFFDKNINEL